ncbi:MAG: hypothetical protein QHJ73_13350, partial [Armatimonadota bacterium]|nr:hypothetical protein [Armatimonadota bacterium]
MRMIHSSSFPWKLLVLLVWVPALLPPAREAVGAPGPREEGLIASPEPDWPQWRGPRRDAVLNEKELLAAWPPEGPRLLWKREGLGTGWVSPIVVNGRIYLAGDVGDDQVIFALDLDGKIVWQARNGAAWKGEYPGARAACAYAGGRLYQMNA